MLDRATAEAAFRDAIAACDPAIAVARAIRQPIVAGKLGGGREGDREVVGVAIGKAAIAMARGAGPVARGIVVAPDGGGRDGDDLPAGWRVLRAGHPVPDARSEAAADALLALVGAARGVVLALVSGGASALVAKPIAGVTLADKRARVQAAMAAGAPIAELNALRRSLSAIKGGGLARASAAPIVTLAISDVVGDDLSIIGSGPTSGRPGDHAEVIAPMATFGKAVAVALAERDVFARRRVVPMVGDVAAVAAGLAADRGDGILVAWGEPTVALPPNAGEGGRAQQLALALAQLLRGTSRAALVIGSDGADGPPPASRPTPAGAFVDGTTWDAIAAAGLDGRDSLPAVSAAAGRRGVIDPASALARCDAGPALAAVGALIVTGPTGVNFADLVLLG